jgi:hypothetical protein
MTRRVLAGKSLPGELYPHGLADLHRLDFLIDSDMTLAHTALVTALHPRSNGLFRTAASRSLPCGLGDARHVAAWFMSLEKTRKKLTRFLTHSRLDKWASG